MKKQKPNQATDKCGCEVESIVFLPCSGGSNCGQLANQTAIELTDAGMGNIYCLAGLGAHIEGMVNSVKMADKIVVIDGCATACARKVLEHLSIPVSHYICITELGITKNHDFNLVADDITLVTNYVEKLLSK